MNLMTPTKKIALIGFEEPLLSGLCAVLKSCNFTAEQVTEIEYTNLISTLQQIQPDVLLVYLREITHDFNGLTLLRNLRMKFELTMIDDYMSYLPIVFLSFNDRDRFLVSHPEETAILSPGCKVIKMPFQIDKLTSALGESKKLNDTTSIRRYLGGQNRLVNIEASLKHDLANILGAHHLLKGAYLAGDISPTIYKQSIERLTAIRSSINDFRLREYEYLSGYQEGESPDISISQNDDPLNTLVIGKRILYIDDEHGLGWSDVLAAIMYPEKVLSPLRTETAPFLMSEIEEEGKVVFRSIGNKYPHKKESEDLFTTALWEYLSDNAANLIDDFDLLLLDVRLRRDEEKYPDMKPQEFTGAKILDLLKKINPGFQVVMFTASSRADIMKQLRDMRANGFWTKKYKFIDKDEIMANYLILKDHIYTAIGRSYIKRLWPLIIQIDQQFDFEKTNLEKAFDILIAHHDYRELYGSLALIGLATEDYKDKRGKGRNLPGRDFIYFSYGLRSIFSHPCDCNVHLMDCYLSLWAAILGFLPPAGNADILQECKTSYRLLIDNICLNTVNLFDGLSFDDFKKLDILSFGVKRTEASLYDLWMRLSKFFFDSGKGFISSPFENRREAIIIRGLKHLYDIIDKQRGDLTNDFLKEVLEYLAITSSDCSFSDCSFPPVRFIESAYLNAGFADTSRITKIRTTSRGITIYTDKKYYVSGFNTKKNNLASTLSLQVDIYAERLQGEIQKTPSQGMLGSINCGHNRYEFASAGLINHVTVGDQVSFVVIENSNKTIEASGIRRL